MSTDLKSRTKDVSLTRFFGGADPRREGVVMGPKR